MQHVDHVRYQVVPSKMALDRTRIPIEIRVGELCKTLGVHH